ncbi:hypothetical protein SAY87_022546 [Trapa incisa]|uniref:30S ribosomal protein S31, chloroplastic n=1 Tax=Trapa incisa TaxID=236973 RepID=A0AAN7KAD5_9MYRT|nr:hypothetical protein SAY87_022546 [Trapa incisa]
MDLISLIEQMSPLAFPFLAPRPWAAPPSPPPLSSPSAPPLPLLYCGRGDKKTAKGKRFNHSFGNARPRNKNKGRGPPRVPKPPAPRKKDRFEDDEKVTIEIDE